jgi:phage FluMu protein Com
MSEENKEEIVAPVQTTPPPVVQTPLTQSLQSAQAPQKKSLNIRCLACGHFLLEIVTDTAAIKTLCRQARCKTVNYVVINNGNVNCSIEEKRKIMGYDQR